MGDSDLYSFWAGSNDRAQGYEEGANSNNVLCVGATVSVDAPGFLVLPLQIQERFGRKTLFISVNENTARPT
ncbi:hypothetical protein PSCICM_29020 [Pseudomonas cichorii]|nr:hypothetical protein PSCICM_29020 [Pseudomonas cichorii]